MECLLSMFLPLPVMIVAPLVPPSDVSVLQFLCTVCDLIENCTV